jgi:hypothetical protein
MVVILGLERNHINVLEPFDHAPTNVSRNNETNRKAVIRLQLLAVGFVGNQDIVGRVHGTSQRNTRTVLDKLTPGLVLEGTRSHLVGEILDTDKLDVLAGHVAFRNAGI